MGCVSTIGHTRFPRQGPFIGRRVRVTFHYQAAEVLGTVVRDDAEEPHELLIQLDDGRFVRSAECQWTGCS